jgi:hypothetical protein
VDVGAVLTSDSRRVSIVSDCNSVSKFGGRKDARLAKIPLPRTEPRDPPHEASQLVKGVHACDLQPIESQSLL